MLPPNSLGNIELQTCPFLILSLSAELRFLALDCCLKSWIFCKVKRLANEKFDFDKEMFSQSHLWKYLARIDRRWCLTSYWQFLDFETYLTSAFLNLSFFSFPFVICFLNSKVLKPKQKSSFNVVEFYFPTSLILWFEMVYSLSIFVFTISLRKHLVSATSINVWKCQLWTKTIFAVVDTNQ